MSQKASLIRPQYRTLLSSTESTRRANNVLVEGIESTRRRDLPYLGWTDATDMLSPLCLIICCLRGRVIYLPRQIAGGNFSDIPCSDTYKAIASSSREEKKSNNKPFLPRMPHRIVSEILCLERYGADARHTRYMSGIILGYVGMKCWLVFSA